jgi:Ca-activated chloride channel homolog
VTFLWPEMLWLWLAVPALIGIYLLVLRRQRKAAWRFASVGLVRQAAGSARRRHVPPLLLLASIALLITAVARPATMITLPTHHQTVMLAVDVSISMRAQDVAPDRITAAQEAAMTFVREQPRNTRIGVVQYAGTAALVQPPTSSREDVLGAIERLQLNRATAIGSGILVSLMALFPDLKVELTPPRNLRGEPMPVRGRPPQIRVVDPPGFVPVAPGSNASAVVVLLTDGQNTTGPDPVEAARVAAQRGIRIYTVGIGTPEGQMIQFEGWQVRVRLDEDTLKQVAAMTQAEYFHAATAEELQRVYQALNARFTLERRQTEVTALFSAAAGLLSMFAGLLSLLWFNRLF